MARRRKGMPTGTTIRTDKEAKEDLLLMISLRKRGMTWRDIADEINKDRPYNLSFQNYYSQYTSELPKTLDQKELVKYRREMVRDIELEIDELWNSWLQSKEKRTSRRTVKRFVVGNEDLQDDDDDGVEKQEITTVTETGIGDPSFLVAITRKRERLAKLTGADVPSESVNRNYDMNDQTDIDELEKRLKLERSGNK